MARSMSAQQQHKQPPTYPAKLTIVTTASMVEAIARAARRQIRSGNSYVRAAVLAQLRADGDELVSE